VLSNILALEDGSGFVRELVEGFVRDGERNLEAVHEAVKERDYERYRDAVHALKGSAGELGATLLVELCIRSEALKPFDLETGRIAKAADELRQLFDRSCHTLTELVEHRRDAMT
jgi:two-component system sensor histidine kinase RpfC